MRSRIVFCLLLAACGDNKGSSAPVDASRVDGKTIDAADIDAAPMPLDANPSDQIGGVKMTADGSALALPIGYAIVTYIKPQIGSTTNDPAGFTIQAQKFGPGIFVAVDPATTTPPLVRGDVINFTVTDLVTVGGQKRISGISNLTRISQGFDVTTLSQDVSAATDLVTNLENYESELIDITGMLGATFSSSGSGFEKVQLTTAGMPANASFVVRVPTSLRDAIDMTPTCTVTLKDTPVGKFFNTSGTQMETQLAAFTAGDVTLTGCAAPTVSDAEALSPTSVRITFTRNVLPGSVMADGSQFTFDNGLVASAATVSGRTVTITTGAQAVGTIYTVTVATTVTDLQGSPLATPNTATFPKQPASVKLNELNAHIDGGCDLVELRVTASGTLDGIQIKERIGVVHTFAALDVQKNDIIVLHFGNAACNPGTSANETTIDGQPAGTFAQNYDTAFDIYSTDTGITDTDNVITIVDKLGAIVDVVLIDDDAVPPANVAAGSETAAAAAVVANQWQNVGGGTPPGGYVDDTFRFNAVLDSNDTGTASTGDSLRRIDDTDENEKADWAQGASTFGVINDGQATLP